MATSLARCPHCRQRLSIRVSVLDAIRHGCTTSHEIEGYTGLHLNRIHRALSVLRHQQAITLVGYRAYHSTKRPCGVYQIAQALTQSA